MPDGAVVFAAGGVWVVVVVLGTEAAVVVVGTELVVLLVDTWLVGVADAGVGRAANTVNTLNPVVVHEIVLFAVSVTHAGRAFHVPPLQR